LVCALAAGTPHSMHPHSSNTNAGRPALPAPFANTELRPKGASGCEVLDMADHLTTNEFILLLIGK
jgi:hypothetical protein